MAPPAPEFTVHLEIWPGETPVWFALRVRVAGDSGRDPLGPDGAGLRALSPRSVAVAALELLEVWWTLAHVQPEPPEVAVACGPSLRISLVAVDRLTARPAGLTDDHSLTMPFQADEHVFVWWPADPDGLLAPGTLSAAAAVRYLQRAQQGGFR